MKILQVINSLATGGAEKLLLETLPIYKESGIQMDLLVLNGTDVPFMAELKALDCCTIYSLGTQSVYNPLNIFKIIPYLKQYDLIHVHLFPAQYWVALAKMFSFSRVKLIFTEHSTSNRRIESNVLVRLIDRFFYRKYDKIICITPEVLKVQVQHTKIPLQKFEVIANGVNIDKVKDAAPLAKTGFFQENEDLKIVIQVSSFQEPKDQATLINALALLPNDVKLILVGDGVLRKDAEKQVADLGLEKKVVFLGLRMDVPQLLKTADIVVLSSKYEGLSLSSIEGMASGKPFLASDVPGLKDIVKGAGILFPVGNAKVLSDEILRLIENPNHYHSVVHTCQQRASDYDIHQMVETHIKLYNTLN